MPWPDEPAGEAGLRGHESMGWRRRGLLAIPHAHLGAVLGLPGYITPLFVLDEVLRGRVVVLAESDIFPEVAPGSEPPVIPLNALVDAAGEVVRWDTGEPLATLVEPGGYAYERWARMVEEADDRAEELRDTIELAITAHGDAEAIDKLVEPGDDDEATYRRWLDRLFACAARRGVAPDDHSIDPADPVRFTMGEAAAAGAVVELDPATGTLRPAR